MNRPITTHTGHLTAANKRHICAIFDSRDVTPGSAFTVNRINYHFIKLDNDVWTVEKAKATIDGYGRRTMNRYTATWSWKT